MGNESGWNREKADQQIEGGINGFKYSPDLKKIAYSAEVDIEDPNMKKALFEGLTDDQRQGL